MLPANTSRKKTPAASPGFTLIELLTVIAIIGILAAIIIPTVGKTRQLAKRTQSLNRLRMIGQTLHLYLADNKQVFPLLANTEEGGWGDPFWTKEAIQPYETPVRGGWTKPGNGSILQSPMLMDTLIENPNHQPLGDYGGSTVIFDKKIRRPYSSLVNPSRTAMVMTARTDTLGSNGEALPSYYVEAEYFVNDPTRTKAAPQARGGDSVLVVFADGHTRMIPLDVFIQEREQLLLNK
ncbi:prepilin-type N-terminal cleavage/methylation domain-containing protein [Opitutaceae bacterium TAV1]|nr:prepilin-type N-terminal cleavage/methylation domain-containing protein [Opitutaceae bacterium TAV1]